MKHSLVACKLRVVIALLAVFASSLAAARPPNIILILADDLGAETIGAYGGESYRTPRLDRMAEEGLRFEHGHAQPLCTPSRVKIMTGQYNFRNYQHFGYLDPNETTFAHVLGDAGYATGVIGKWQLFDNRFQDLEGALPKDAGFDEYVLWQLKKEQRGSRYWAPLIDDNGDVREYGEDSFGPDVLNSAALDFIDSYADRPFFLYYPMVLPHSPFVTTPYMSDEDAGDQQRFGAMVAYMDTLVGQVLDKIEALGLGENTLILFIGDNGTDRNIVSRYQGKEIRGQKGDTVNAGSRVPFIAWGNGVAGGGRVSNSLVSLNDVLPTLSGIAGASLPPQYPGDGQSLLPVFSGEGELARESLFIHYEPRWPTGRPARYAFDRRWKLYERGDFYDMLADPLETNALKPGGLEREGLVAYRALQGRIKAMPGELVSRRPWIPTVGFVMVGLALLLVVTPFIWVARLIGRLQDEK